MYWCCAQVEPRRERLASYCLGLAAMRFMSRGCASRSVVAAAAGSGVRRRCFRVTCFYGWFPAGGMRVGRLAWFA